jgi:hypothetical protein
MMNNYSKSSSWPFYFYISCTDYRDWPNGSELSNSCNLRKRGETFCEFRKEIFHANTRFAECLDQTFNWNVHIDLLGINLASFNWINAQILQMDLPPEIPKSSFILIHFCANTMDIIWNSDLPKLFPTLIQRNCRGRTVSTLACRDRITFRPVACYLYPSRFCSIE